MINFGVTERKRGEHLGHELQHSLDRTLAEAYRNACPYRPFRLKLQIPIQLNYSEKKARKQKR
jgi:hypothetical protein